MYLMYISSMEGVGPYNYKPKQIEEPIDANDFYGLFRLMMLLGNKVLNS